MICSNDKPGKWGGAGGEESVRRIIQQEQRMKKKCRKNREAVDRFEMRKKKTKKRQIEIQSEKR